MRVVHLAASGHIGGAERVMLTSLDALPDVNAAVVTLGTGPLAGEVERLGLSCSVVQAPAAIRMLGDSFASAPAVARAMVPASWQVPGFLRRFSNAVGRLEPDLLHSHGIKTHVLAALAKPRAPLIWHLHDYAGARSVSSRLLRSFARRCAMAIAVSESVAEDARTWLPHAVPVVVVRNSVDCDRFRPDGPALDLDALCAMSPAPPGTVRVGFPATFARWKGHEVFLDAMAMLRRDDVRGYVIGGPVYETRNSQWSERELRSLVAGHGLGAKVGLTGYVEDMPGAYRALDVVVHASTRPEPFGLVIAEAMACGRALVASPGGGAGELFADGTEAVAAESGRAEALASALRVLVADPDRRRALGDQARAHALRHFSRDRFAAELSTALSRFKVPAARIAT